MTLDRCRDEFPILSRHRLHDQQLARRHAAADGAQPRRVRRHLGDARRARVGRALVGDAGRGRQQDRARHRRAGRHGEHARERDDGADGRAVVGAAVGRAGNASSVRRWISRRWCICTAPRRPRASNCASCPARTISRSRPSACSTPSTTPPRWSPSPTCCFARRTSSTPRRSRAAPATSGRR